MGYFSNGTAGEMYEAQYCARCIHGPVANPDKGCTVWMLHMLHNYEDCNNPKSMLHDLIPLAENRVDNQQCTMFAEAPDLPDTRQEVFDL